MDMIIMEKMMQLAKYQSWAQVRTTYTRLNTPLRLRSVLNTPLLLIFFTFVMMITLDVRRFA